MLLALRGVGKVFSNGVTALSDVDLTIREGDFLSLLGPSGCGKSTALRLIAGLSTPTSGVLDWRGSGAFDRSNIGFVFQEPTLLPWANVFDNVWLPLRLKGVSRAKAAPAVMEMLARVHLTGFENAVPRELSGGMKMRVSIARAMVTKPRVLLMDEPFAALDEITRFKLNNDLLELWQDERFTVVFVTHSVFESVFLSNRIVVMAARPGRVLQNSPSTRPIRATRCSAPRPTMPRSAARRRTCWSAPSTQPPDRIMTAIAAAADARPRGGAPRAPGAARADRQMGVAAGDHDPGDLAVGPHLRLERYPAIHPAAPGVVLQTLYDDAGLLFSSLLVTLRITFLSLLLAVVGGVGLAVLFAQSKWVEMSFFPFAIVLQVTPIVAIFPLINIYVDNQTTKLLLCAWIVAFFPILSNTTLGLNSVDRNLRDMFKLNGATRWQQLRYLRLPAAMPYFLGGLKIAGGLSLIGAVVAEFVAGAAGPVVGACLAHHRGRLSAQRAAAVRGADPDLAHRHRDLPGAVADFASHSAALARERAEAGAIMMPQAISMPQGGSYVLTNVRLHASLTPDLAAAYDERWICTCRYCRRRRHRSLPSRPLLDPTRQLAPSTSPVASCCPASSTATPISTRAISGRASPIPTALSWAR